MKQEDKELLLKDLCARLPYGVVIQEKCLEHDGTFFPYAEDNKVVNIDVHEDLVITGGCSWYYIEDIKPYLLPLSSMTEEQKKELKNEVCPDGTGYFNEESLICPATHIGDRIPFKFMSKIIDWLNKNHFDYRGLIEKGLAIDATGLNIY